MPMNGDREVGRTGRRLLSVLLPLALCACAPVGRVAGPPARTADGQVRVAAREQIDLSGTTLTLVTPSLRPSRDFPPPRLLHEIDLAQIVKPRLVFHGYWDGPRYQFLSVTGTMRVWLDIRRWPEAARAAVGCDAKTRAYVDQDIERDRASYKGSSRHGEPEFEVIRLPVAGRSSLRYVQSFDPSTTYYMIPFDREFVLTLIFESALNSDPAAGWPALFEREKDGFLSALQLSGDAGDCR